MSRPVANVTFADPPTRTLAKRARGAAGERSRSEPRGQGPREKVGEHARRFAFHGLILATIVVGSGCKRQSEEEQRAEAGRVARAVEALRAAPSGERAPRLSALEAVPCRDGDVCVMKDACVEAYRLELTALDALRAVRAETRKADSLGQDSVDLLAAAERDLGEAKDKAKRCADLEAAVRRKNAL